MLGHRGGGGGHHHHGGGHHHHHHGGGAIYAHGGYPRYYPYGYPPPPEVIVVETKPACPDTWAPVVGSDGRLYRNACVAQKHGVGFKRNATGFEVKRGPVLGRVRMRSRYAAAGCSGSCPTGCWLESGPQGCYCYCGDSGFTARLRGALGDVNPAVTAVGIGALAVAGALAYGAITREHRWRRR